MNSNLFKLLPVAAATALLVACGGNDTAPNANVPWASPAMIVPPGSASKTLALTNCNAGLRTATLVVTSSGDMILSGAPIGTTTISELNRVNYATAVYTRVEAENGGDGLGMQVYAAANSNDRIYANAGSYGFSVYSDRDTAPTHNYSCELAGGTTSFALTVLPSSQRLASQMTNGITGIDTTRQPGTSATFASGVATWDSYGSSSPYRYVQLNVNTGALGSSATSTGTFATTAITIPTTPTSTYAYFSEENDNGVKEFYAEIQQASGTFGIQIQRIANLLKPRYWD